MSETWLPIAGFDGLYEVSSAGSVRSLDRLDSQGNRIKGRELSADARPSGHLRATLSQQGKTYRFWVHRLVLEAFVGPRNAGQEACHYDGNPQNNRVENLRWDTKSANARDRIRHGNDRQSRKTHCPRWHEYTPENTYLHNDRKWRRCKTCTLNGQHERNRRIKNEREASRGYHQHDRAKV